VPWAGAALLILPWGQGFQALLQKALRFKPIAQAEMAGSCAGAVVAITSALAGMGVYALIWGQLANALVRTVPIAVQGWRQHAPALHLSLAELRGDLRFGAFQMGERTLGLINARLDQLLIGAVLGPETLGYYNLAWQMTLQPLARLNPVVMRVAFPLFARIQHEQPRLRRGYFQAQRLLGAVNFPLFLGLAVLAPVFVPTVFGSRWVPAVELVQLLAGVAVFRAIGNPVGACCCRKDVPAWGSPPIWSSACCRCPPWWRGLITVGQQGWRWRCWRCKRDSSGWPIRCSSARCWVPAPWLIWAVSAARCLQRRSWRRR